METHGVTVRELRALGGPNQFARKPVLHVVLDIGPYEDRPSNSFPGFVERLTSWLPGLQRHECGIGRPGGFVERLRGGTYLGHIAEHVTLELQNLMGFDVGFGRARGTGEPGVYNVVFAYGEVEPAKAAFETALRLTLAAMQTSRSTSLVPWPPCSRPPTSTDSDPAPRQSSTPLAPVTFQSCA